MLCPDSGKKPVLRHAARLPTRPSPSIASGYYVSPLALKLPFSGWRGSVRLGTGSMT